MKYTVLADHNVIDQVEITVYAPNPDAAITLVSSMGFFNIAMVWLTELQNEDKI